MKKVVLLFPLLLSSFFLLSQNALPVIENVQVELGPNDLLTFTYDLSDVENDPCEITFRATEKGGLSFDFDTGNATGDVGAGIQPGPGKQLEWDYSSLGLANADFRLMLVADDGQAVDIQELVNQVDSVNLLDDLTFLEGVRHRTAGAAHLEETQDFIQFQFLDENLETSVQEWDFGNYTGKNIIGRKIGTSEEATVYIVDGHYDTVNDAPGADDNASAVAGMLEALRVMSPYSFKKSIRFIGFDLEEAGLKGSIEYVQNPPFTNETTAGVFNFEMIGYYSEAPSSQTIPQGFGFVFPDAVAAIEANESRGDFITVMAEPNSGELASDFENAASEHVPSLKVIVLEAPVGWESIPQLVAIFARSDHFPFWQAEKPALFMTDGAEFRNPYYHSPEDKTDKLNFTFMRQVTQATVATIAELAEIQHATTWWTDTEFFTPTTETTSCDFRISPNPVQDILRVEWPACQPGDFAVELLDINGRIVRSYQVRKGDGIDFQLVDVRGLDAGVYFLRLQNGEETWAERVVVD